APSAAASSRSARIPPLPTSAGRIPRWRRCPALTPPTASESCRRLSAQDGTQPRDARCLGEGPCCGERQRRHWGDRRSAVLMRRRAKLNAQSETSGRRARIPKRQMCTEATMLREQMITLLQTCVVFLLLTNTASLLAAIYAVRQTRPAPAQQRSKS